MSNLGDALKAMKGQQGPGTMKSLLAGFAIAWGTRTFSTQAMEAAERRDAANAECEMLRLEIESAHELLSERLIEAIRDGYADAAVKARAAALGWVLPDPIPAEDVTVFAPLTDAYMEAHQAEND